MSDAEKAIRPSYRKLSEDEERDLNEIRDFAMDLWASIDEMGPSRETALAKTKVEEAVMWATKHLKA